MFDNLYRSYPTKQRTPHTPPDDNSQSSRTSTRVRNLKLNVKFDRAESPPPQTLEHRLTDTLLRSCPDHFKAATQHSFLRSAGRGTLSKTDLSRWLSQDRLYAETYISFITAVLSQVTLPYAFISDKSASLRWRIIHLLTGALENIHRELDFFTATATKYGLQLDLPFDQETSATFGPNSVTEQYISLFQSFHLDPHQPLLDGLVVLWGTEKCYLEAWTYASTYIEPDADLREDADGGALRNEFIPNWSSDEFKKFVQDIADVTDELAAREGALRKIEVFKALWLHVLDIERGFWPNLDGEH